MKVPVQRLLARSGLALVPHRTSASEHLARSVRRHGVRAVVDVGANAGQFGTRLRSLGVDLPLISFEPMAAAHEQLVRSARSDPSWHVVHAAASSERGRAVLNVAGNSTSSSLYEVTEVHTGAAAESRTVRTEVVQTVRLDEVVPSFADGPYFVKIDVQGGELLVLDGAPETLSNTALLQLEVSLRPLYAGAPTYLDVLTRVARDGFTPISVEVAFADPRSGDALQLDVLCVASGST